MLTRQIALITQSNLRGIPQRLGPSVVIVIGIAGVVAVLISVLSMSTGLRQTIANSGRADRAIVLSRGAESEAGSSLTRSNTLSIMNAVGIKRTPEGQAIGSAEVLIAAPVARRSDGADAYVSMRGVGPQALALRPEFKLIEGRMFRPAVHELLVGKSAQTQFAGLDVGSRIILREGEWTVVGSFSSGGNSHESELLADADTVMSAYRVPSFRSVTVLLDSEQSYDRFKDALGADPTLTVDIKREQEYFANVSKPLNQLLTVIAYLIGGIMTVGALAGALNTMYSAVSVRTREIATLRAIGFGGTAVVIPIFIEALLLASFGAGIGIALAYLLFSGHTISTIGGASGNSQLVYSLTITPRLVVLGVALGCVIGFLGGLFPAIRAARLPVADALRAS